MNVKNKVGRMKNEAIEGGIGEAMDRAGGDRADPDRRRGPEAEGGRQPGIKHLSSQGKERANRGSPGEGKGKGEHSVGLLAPSKGNRYPLGANQARG